ncbi:AP2/ERF domain-containing protein [Chloropicon primus]|uniref:AP2/ERF domain-containing protein n=1 Tax=Chloropicon primus TaxID=1764295 RepID=A0A5B8ML56_9CHLO|nr:hypothetical protein A3770_05p37240 [Chloropicon primus]UPR00420.1 AP2/ERF domain-containing protein [Chloropicon primus]|eukprot:QDZ21206.1 hypothetical protein A3770_05p37240 [Chloropicon primus]
MAVWSPLDDLDEAEKKKEEKVKKHPTVEDLENHDTSMQFQNSNNYSTIVFSNVENVEESIGKQIQFPDPQYSRRAQQIRRIYLNGSPELKTPRSSRPVTAATTSRPVTAATTRDMLSTPGGDLNTELPEEPPLPYQILKKKQKGIYKHNNRWRARLWIPEKGEIYLGHYRSKEDAALAFDRAAIALRTYAKATKQGLNYSKDIYKEEFRLLEDLGIDTVACKLRTHAEKENSWQNMENYDLPADS